MFKKRPIDILLGLAVLSLAGMLLYKKLSPSQKIIRHQINIVKANDILKRKAIISDTIINTTATSSACTLFLKKSAEQSVMEYANEFFDGALTDILKTCQGALPTNVQNKIDIAMEVCRNSKRENVQRECYSALLNAKTASVAAIIKPDAFVTLLDSTTLLHLITEKFSSNELFETPLRSLELVNELLRKEPQYLNGYKVKLILLALSSLNTEEVYQDQFFEVMMTAKKLSPHDRDLLELDLIERTQYIVQDENPDDFAKAELIEFLDKESAKHPNDWLYDYYKAYAIYQQGKGDFDQTLALLESAQKKAPSEQRISATIEKLKSDDIHIKIRPFTISISFTLDDL